MLSWAAALTAYSRVCGFAAAVNCVAEEGIMCSGSVGPSSATARHSFHLHQPSPPRSTAVINTRRTNLSGIGWESGKCRTQQLTSSMSGSGGEKTQLIKADIIQQSTMGNAATAFKQLKL
eukprot:scaffold130831_cov36-Cyclotella_meneghiniana.AAC.1